MKVPAPVLLMGRLYGVLEAHPDLLELCFLYDIVIDGTRIAKSRNENLILSLSTIMRKMVVRQDRGRVIDSWEYPDLCRRISQTLGSHLLVILAEYSLAYIPLEDDDITEDVVKKKAELFALAAIEVAESGVGSPGFTEWPIVEYSSQSIPSGNDEE